MCLRTNRSLYVLLITALLTAILVSTTTTTNPPTTQVPPRLFHHLESLARLVDTTYCVGAGNTGIHHPFICASRCTDFPGLELVSTFDIGVLGGGGCGFVAVEHGKGEGGVEEEEEEEKEEDKGWEVGGGEGKGEDEGKDRGKIIVAFRGTYSIANTIVDLSTKPQEYIPYPSSGDGGDEGFQNHCTNCTVHSGFYTSWQHTRQLILSYLTSLRYRHPTYTLHLVGHSLGGAVAALAGLEMEGYGWRPVVTTFGEPRIGNEGLRDFVDARFGLGGNGTATATAMDGKKTKKQSRVHMRYRRVTHKGDPVPLLPLGEWGYVSHGGEIFIGKERLQPDVQDVMFCEGDEDPACIFQDEEDAKETVLAARSAAGLDDFDVSTSQEHLASLGGPASHIWELFFAHRDYFWRLGLCVPGGDPLNWGRHGYGDGEREDL